MEMCYKIKNGLYPEYLDDLITDKTVDYNIRVRDNLCIPKFKTVTYGKNCLKYFVAFYWNKLHNDIKQAETLNIFKISLNKWKVECKFLYFM